MVSGRIVATAGPSRWWRRSAADDAGSMTLAVLLTICALSLSAAVSTVALVQVGDTRRTVTRGHARDAAQTGLQVAVAAVHAAHGANLVQGDRALLPCGPITGDAGTVAAASYQVSLTYFDDDPDRAQSAAMTCTAARSGPTPPRFVQLTSTGTTVGGQISRRVLRGNYPLRFAPATETTDTWGPEFDEAVHPRLIAAWSPSKSSTHVCLDPGSGRPPPGRVVRLQVCNDNVEDNGYKQFFFYRENLTIATVGSLLANSAACLDAGPTPTAGVAITMQTCVTPVPARQRWYYTSSANFELATATGPGPDDVALSGMCLNVANPATPGGTLVLGAGANCRSATHNTRQTFSMYTKVGPGQAGTRPMDCTAAAGYPCTLTQLRNNGMPSRCLEKYSSFMANIECVQDPDPAKVRWSQLWRLPATADGPTGAVGPIVTVDPGGATHCLTTSASSYPTQNPCDPLHPAPGQVFTRYADTGDEFTMYRIVDAQNRCLTHPNANDDNYTEDWKYWWTQAYYQWRSRVSRCVDSASDPAAKAEFHHQSVLKRQKWNAPFQLPAGPPEVTPPAGPSLPASTGVPRIRSVVELPAGP
jgi:hypothetical protein